MTSSARRALRVLEVVNGSNEPLGVTAIADAVGTLPGTAFRSLDALERCAFVSRYRASTQYQMGSAASRLKHTLYAQFPLRNMAMPFLRRLAFATLDTVSLTVPVGWFGLRLAVVAGARGVRSATSAGIVGTLDDSFAGMIILAGFDEPTLERFFAEAPPPATGTRNEKAVRSLLRGIARHGYSVDETVTGPGHRAIALPIRSDGRTIAGVAIEGPVADVENGPDPTELASWQAIVSEIGSLFEQADLAMRDPFEHLDPAAITGALLDHPADTADDDEDD